MSKKMHPTPAMVNDLRKLFVKHNWSGRPIGMVAADTTGDDPANCPEDKTPQTVCYYDETGTMICKTMCL